MIEVQSADLKRLAAGAKVFPKPLRAAVRKEIAATAKESQQAVKSKIRGMSSKGAGSYAQGAGVAKSFRLSSGSGSLRSDIAAATRTSVTLSSRGAQARIYIANTAALKAHRRFRAAQLLDKGPFRHPVYGSRTAWADQAGFSYFRETILGRAPLAREAMGRTLIEAARVTLPNVR